MIDKKHIGRESPTVVWPVDSSARVQVEMRNQYGELKIQGEALVAL
ncbi:MAG TPA: hypothetical protein VGE08_06655 [Steroidobacter sp.]